MINSLRHTVSESTFVFYSSSVQLGLQAVSYARFSKGGAGNSENYNNEDQNKIFPPVRFLAQNQVTTKKKSGLHSDLVRFLAQNWVKAKKKVFTHRLCAQTFYPSYKGRAMPQFCILFYANYTILATQRGGPCPSLNTPLTTGINMSLERQRIAN